MLFLKKKQLKLPTTLSEFDNLVGLLIKNYNLTDSHHTAAVLSVAIRHLPPETAYTTLDYLGHYILKNIANYVANQKSSMLQHEAQIDQLIQLLSANINDNQARDALVKASTEGSTYAREALMKLGLEDKESDPLPN